MYGSYNPQVSTWLLSRDDFPAFPVFRGDHGRTFVTMPAVVQAGGVNCRNAFVSFKDRKSVELAKAI